MNLATVNLAKATNPQSGSIHSEKVPSFGIYNRIKRGLFNKHQKEIHTIATSPSDPNKNRKTEIISFSNDLREFGLSFVVLSEKSPKKRDDRLKAFKLAKCLEKDAKLKDAFLTKKQLPIEGLTEQTDVTKDFLKKNHSYITAISLLIIGEYTGLQGFLEGGVH